MFSRQREHLGSGLRQFGQLVACRQYNGENMAVQQISHTESFLKRNVKFHISTVALRLAVLGTRCNSEFIHSIEHSIEHGVTRLCTSTTQFVNLAQFLSEITQHFRKECLLCGCKGLVWLPTLQVSIFKTDKVLEDFHEKISKAM